MATSSTVARWELAHRIKVRRQELGVSVDQIAKHLGFTRNFFSAVEHQRSMLAPDKLEVLLVLLEFGESERKELTALDEAARKRGWWETKENVDVLDDRGARFLGLELGAAEIYTFDSLLVPGLLQLPEYIRAFQHTDPGRSALDIDKTVAIRVRRQDDVFGGQPQFTALLTEAALRWRWGDASLWERQLQHILNLATSGAVDLRVLTFDTSPGIIASSSTLVLLSFASAHLPDVCYEESTRELDLITQGDPEFDRLRLSWRYAADVALGHHRSLAFIENMLSE